MAVIDNEPFEYEKQPTEKEIIGVDFSRRIPSGVTIDSYDVTAELYGNSSEKIAAAGNLDTTMTVSGAAVTKKTLSCLIADGLDGYKYRVTFRVILSDGQEKEEDIYVTITEK